MKPVEIVQRFVAALEAGNVEMAAQYLSDDFTFSGLTSLPIMREQYLQVLRGLISAFPDLRFNLRDIREEAGVIKVTAHITGTQRGELVLPLPDLPAVRPTGRRISLPDETQIFTVRGSKISFIKLLLFPGGGFQGLYRQLGVRLPVPENVTG